MVNNNEIKVEILLFQGYRGCRENRGYREGYGFLRKPIYIVGFADGLWLPNVLKRIRFLFSLHCTYKSPMRKAEKGMERWLRSSRIGCTIAHGTHAANRRNTHEQMRKLTRGQAPLTAPKNSGRHRRRRRTYTIIQVEIDPNTGNISTVRSREWERLPSQAPRSSGGCRQRRLGGCTLVQVEIELKGKLIPGELPRSG